MMEYSTLNFHCYLCRSEIIPRATSDKFTSTFVTWEEKCAESLRVILELDKSFEPLIKSAVYCDSCLVLVRDMNFLRKSIDRFQQRLNWSRERVKYLLRNYYYTVVQETEYSDSFSDVKLNPSDHFVKAVAEALSFDYETKPKDFGSVQFTVERDEEKSSTPKKRTLLARRKHKEPVTMPEVEDLELDGGDDNIDCDPDFLPSHDYSEETTKEGSQELGKGKRNKKANSRFKELLSRQRNFKQAVSPISGGPPARNIKCDRKGCIYRTTSQSYLNIHIRSKHEDDPNPYHCEGCDKKFASCIRLTRHQQLNCSGMKRPVKPRRARPLLDEAAIQERNIRCSYPHCPYKTDSEFWLLVHRNKSHGEDSLTPFHCQTLGCGQRFKSRKDMNAHVSAGLCQVEVILPGAAGDEDTNDAITETPCVNTNIIQFAVSKRRKSNLASAVSDPKRCEVCSKGFDTAEEVQSHVELHRQREAENIDLAFSCVMPNCDKRFVCSLYLKYHVYNDHESTGVKCQVCGLVVIDVYRLSLHMRKRHSTPNPAYMCPEPECTFRGTCNADLRNHSVKHSGMKPHQCAVCGNQFTWMHSLKVHMRGHENFTPYKCSFTNCEKAFTTSYKLRTHEESHSTTSNYICAMCPKAYKFTKHLSRHIRDVHQVHENVQKYCLLKEPSSI